ncbi:MAG: hypothetical protein R2751_19455 [Bacteroidales bacterium]
MKKLYTTTMMAFLLVWGTLAMGQVFADSFEGGSFGVVSERTQLFGLCH